MKQRFSSLDIRAIAHELSQTLSSDYRLSNVYDLTSRIFLLRFAKPNSKQLLLIDSGFRCHLTAFHRATTPTPSSFVSKLRRHLRTRRLNGVRQIGTDRILEFTFSDGRYRLYLEFFAGGNVVLCDAEGIILALLRVVTGIGEPGQEAGEVGDIKVGVKYQIPLVCEDLVEEKIRETVLDALKKGGVEQAGDDQEEDKPLPIEKTEDKKDVPKNTKVAAGSNKKFRRKKKGEDSLKRVLSQNISQIPPILIEYVLNMENVNLNLRAEDALKDEPTIQKICEAIRQAAQIPKRLTSAETIKGYIIAKLPKKHLETPVDRSQSDKFFRDSEITAKEEDLEVPEFKKDEDGYVYDDFYPFRPEHLENVPGVKILEVDGFNNTVDTFYSSLESQKLTTRLLDRKQAAVKKLEVARFDHEARIFNLQEAQTLNVRKAQAIEANLQKVEEAIAAITSLLRQGMDWVNIGKLVEQEQRKGNSIAELICGLKLKENIITLRLGEEEYGEETGDESEEQEEQDMEYDSESNATREKKYELNLLNVDIDLLKSAWANARDYYDQKKSAAVKEDRTIQSSTRALKSTEKKVLADLQNSLKKEKQLLRPIRQNFWFEKFFFFISTDGYLVLGGRDIQQNELIYRHHFKRGDIYVHADTEGAVSLIVKNNPATATSPIPPTTLAQAGTFLICSSKAWDTKGVTSAWWVTFDQVSKVAKETGEYLAPGNFVITGRKNYLPPVQLVLGYGVMWLIDEASKANHVKKRWEQGGVADTGTEDPVHESDDITAPIPNAPGSVKGEEESEESEDEEFPDAKIDSEPESAEEFPDVKFDSELKNTEEHPDPKAGNTQDTPKEEAVKVNALGGIAQERVNIAYAHEYEKGEGDDDSSISSSSLTAVELDAKRASATSSPVQSFVAGKRHLSTKERRDIKRTQQHQPSGEKNPSSFDESPTAPSSTGKKADQAASLKTQTQGKSTNLPLVRGKKGRQKRVIDKYALQDEEERELAAKFLGTQSMTSTSNPNISSLSKKEQQTLQKKLKEEEERLRKQRRREQHLKVQLEGKRAEEARRADAEGGEEEDHEEEDVAVVSLDCLVGTPFPGDNILEAIPVCMPWAAMSNKYKYKAKIQPGPQKKGKAVKEIIMRWIIEGEKGPRRLDEKAQDIERMWPREMDLLKAWKGDEGVNNIPVGKVKVFGVSGSSSNKGKGSKESKTSKEHAGGKKKQK